MIKLICKCSHSSENTKRHSLQRVRRGGKEKKIILQSLKESCLAEWDLFSLAKPPKWDSSLTETMLVDEVETTEEEEPFPLGKRKKLEHPKLLKSDLSKSKSSQRWHLLCQAAQRFPFSLCLWGLTVSPAMFEQDPLTISIDSGPSPFGCQSASQADRQNKKIWFQAALPFGSSLCAEGPWEWWPGWAGVRLPGSRHLCYPGHHLHAGRALCAARAWEQGHGWASQEPLSSATKDPLEAERLSLKVIMEKAILSLGPMLAGFVDLDKNNPDSRYSTGESRCVTER